MIDSVEAPVWQQVRGWRPRFGTTRTLIRVAAIVIAVAIIAPIVSVGLSVFFPSGEIGAHLAATVLPRYIVNTLWLFLGVGVTSALLGVGGAWLTAICRFPGRGFFNWALILPLALPSYILAYVYYDFLAASGPLQRTIRDLTGLSAGDYWFPRISSLEGAVFILTLALYPYVYLIVRAYLSDQSPRIVEAARSLGCNLFEASWRVMLPLARPAIVVGVTLVLMETLADFGAVSLLGVQTFTTGIYRAYFSMSAPIAAAQLATVLLGFVFILVIIERASRRRARFDATDRPGFHGQKIRLYGGQIALANILCAIPVVLGFVLPVILLIDLAIGAHSQGLGARSLTALTNSVFVGFIAAACAAALALLMVFHTRLSPGRRAVGVNRVAQMGYAIPGTVIAIGTLIPLAAMDRALSAWFDQVLGVDVGLVLIGTVGALVYAYLVRFMAVSIGSVESGFARIANSLDDAASTLGVGPVGRLWRIHIPMVWRSLGVAFVLVFVDVIKELPATLVLRPFNFETLAVEVFNLARDERIAEAALPALILIAVGLIPVAIMSHGITRLGGSKRSGGVLR
ncbi:MAG: iron ABC transporter permease [Pseudomonadota bacterium]